MKSKATQNGLKAPTKDLEISFLVPTPVGFNGEELQIFLQENNVSSAAFAKSGQGWPALFGVSLLTIAACKKPPS